MKSYRLLALRSFLQAAEIMSDERFHVFLRRPPNQGLRRAARQVIEKYKHVQGKTLELAVENLQERPATLLVRNLSHDEAWAVWQDCCDLGLGALIRPALR